MNFVRAQHSIAFAKAILAYFGKTSWRVRGLEREEKRRVLTQQVHTDAQKLLRDLNFEISVVGYDPEFHGKSNFLIVGNHLSYMDPFIMVSAIPALFVTSVDMRETPVLGQICEIAGCIFVERRNRTTIEKDIVEMTDSLKAGLNVAIYPEGKTTDGRDVEPFKKSLLMSAVFAQKDILPVAIRYTEIDGRPWSTETADEIAWWGDMSFTPHFLNLMAKKRVKVELRFLPVIKVTPESTRNELAARAHEAVRGAYLADR